VNALLASKKYIEAEALLLNRLNESLKSGDKTNQGVLLAQLAEVQVAKKDFKKAFSILNQALENEIKDSNAVGQKSILNNIGFFIYQTNNDPDKAIYYYKKAMSIENIRDKDKAKDAIETLNILSNMAVAYGIKKQFDSAKKYFQLSFDQIRPGINESEMASFSLEEVRRLRKVRYITGLFVEKGATFYSQYLITRNAKYLSEAIRIYKVSDIFLDKVKAAQADQDSKLYWRDDSRRLYELAIDACYASQNFKDAFYFFEKSRAVLLNDQLKEQRWLEKEDILKQTLLKKRILKLKHEADAMQKDSTAYQGLQDQLFSARKELDDLGETIKKKNPLYFQNFLDTSIINLEDVKSRVLKDYQGIVEIFSGDSAVYALILTSSKYSLSKIDKTKFDSLANAYLGLVADPNRLNKSYGEFQSVSGNLYQLIFADNNLPPGRIIISPAGQYFPFESLLVDPTKSTSYFVKDYAVSYTYSVRYLFNQFNKKSSSASGTFMGVAPVKFASNSELASLSGSDISLQDIKKYYSSGINLIGADASRNSFLKKFGQYRVVQLYAHAIDGTSNGEPVIYFADSALLLSDLFYEDETHSQLIILSACKTGLGKLYQGEGVFSFNRGFAAAGIPTSIVNLWSVQDESTYKLMKLVNKYLSEGLTTDIALQKAKVEFISNSSEEAKLPYYWAASILVGINDTIDDTKGWSWSIITSVAAIVVLLTFLILWKYRRSKTTK